MWIKLITCYLALHSFHWTITSVCSPLFHLVSGLALPVHTRRTFLSAAVEKDARPSCSHIGYICMGSRAIALSAVWIKQNLRSQGLKLKAVTSQHLPAHNRECTCVLPQHTVQVLPHSPKALVALGTGCYRAYNKNLPPNPLGNWSWYSR